MNYDPRDPDLRAWLKSLSSRQQYVSRCALLKLFESLQAISSRGKPRLCGSAPISTPAIRWRLDNVEYVEQNDDWNRNAESPQENSTHYRGLLCRVVLCLERERARVGFCLPAARWPFAFGRIRALGATSAVAARATAVPAAAFMAFDLATFSIMRPAVDAISPAFRLIAPTVPLDLRIRPPTRSSFAGTFACPGLFPFSAFASCLRDR
jgi:hypothetical protein